MMRPAPARLTVSTTVCSMGRPHSGWSTLARLDRMRVPWPAARMTATAPDMLGSPPGQKPAPPAPPAGSLATPSAPPLAFLRAARKGPGGRPIIISMTLARILLSPTGTGPKAVCGTPRPGSRAPAPGCLTVEAASHYHMGAAAGGAPALNVYWGVV